MQLIGVERERELPRVAEWLGGVAGSRPWRWQNNDEGSAETEWRSRRAKGRRGTPPRREGRVVAVPPAVDGSMEEGCIAITQIAALFSPAEERRATMPVVANDGVAGIPGRFASTPGPALALLHARTRSIGGVSLGGALNGRHVVAFVVGRYGDDNADLVAENHERRYGDRRSNWSSMSHFFRATSSVFIGHGDEIASANASASASHDNARRTKGVFKSYRCGERRTNWCSWSDDVALCECNLAEM